MVILRLRLEATMFVLCRASTCCVVMCCVVLCPAMLRCAVPFRVFCCFLPVLSVRWHAMLGCIDLGDGSFSIGRSFYVLHAGRSLTAPTTTMTAVEFPVTFFFCDLRYCQCSFELRPTFSSRVDGTLKTDRCRFYYLRRL